MRIASLIVAIAACGSRGGAGDGWPSAQLERDIGWFPAETQLVVGYPDWRRGPFGQVRSGGGPPCLAEVTGKLERQYSASQGLGSGTTVVLVGATDRTAFEQCALAFAKTVYGEARLDRVGDLSAIRALDSIAYYAWPSHGAGRVLVVDTDRQRIDGFLAPAAATGLAQNRALVAHIAGLDRLDAPDLWLWAAGTVDVGTPLLGAPATGFGLTVRGAARRAIEARVSFANDGDRDRARVALRSTAKAWSMDPKMSAALGSLRIEADGHDLAVRAETGAAGYDAVAAFVAAKLAPR